jgi:hypothetical protein
MKHLVQIKKLEGQMKKAAKNLNTQQPTAEGLTVKA